MACKEPSNLKPFCSYCEPSVRLAHPEACFWFTGAVRTVIQQAKFAPNETKARRLMRELPLVQVPENLEGIVFVPVHWQRRLKRGFDLSALFALALSKQLQIPVLDWLSNTRLDPPLTLAKSREERIKLTRGRYKLRKKSPPKKILLVDDVTTTGATLEAAKHVLNSAGHEAFFYTLAKTPLAAGQLKYSMLRNKILWHV